MNLPYWQQSSQAVVLSLLLSLGVERPLQGAHSRDQHALVITVSDLATQQTTYYDTVYLDGQVTSASPVTALTINGASLWRREGLQLFFGYIAALQPWDNRFVLEAADKVGHRARQEVVVHRKVEEVKQLDVRLQVMLLPLEQKGEATGLAETVYAALLTALVKQGRFQVIERERLDAVLQEQQLSQTALTDPTTAVRIGRLAGAEGIIVGTVTETQKALGVSIRFVDVETSVILAEEYVYEEEVNPPAVHTLMEGLALKIRQRFPRIQGRVLEMGGEQVFVDLGSQYLKKHMKLLIVRDGEALKHPLTGKLLKALTEVVGEVKVEAVFDEFSQGVLLPSKTPVEVKRLDYVITK
jgi:hypothetical protein